VAGEDPAYVAFVLQSPCRMYMHDPCDPPGQRDPHHAGERGLGQRAHDHTVIPLCRKHHSAWHDCNGVFRRWTKDDRRRFARKHIRRFQRLWRRHLASDTDGQ